jgi:hypothetical protein
MKKLGCVNALHSATIYNKNNKPIGTCGDTPNIIAYMFSKYSEAEKVKTTFNNEYIRESEDIQQRIKTIKLWENGFNYNNYISMN